ncbi:MAG: flagellar export protein FliJ [Methyloprofundus sp.]|nr:flagellar export protein FliJ [Methyloprofundus sp.]MDT8424775.1 flagellar export protein FliJ [Methyloprofundus sp.]
MKRSQRLQVIVDLKINQEKKYLDALGKQRNLKLQKETQLNSLKNYRQDYRDKNDKLIKNGISVTQLMEFRAFMEKMDKAIEGEERTLKMLDSELERLRKNWEEAHMYTEGIQKIQGNARVSEQKQEEKKEQLEMDDRAARKKR